MNLIRLARLAIVCTFLTGCATAYKPSENVKAMTSRMSEQEAMHTLQKMLTARDMHGNLVKVSFPGYVGLCNSNGFMIEYANGGDVQVSHDGITVAAYKRGPIIKTDGTFNYYKKIPYREDLRFANISHMTVSEPITLNSSCGRKEGQSEVFIRESFVRWYAVLIPTAEKEQFIAAMLRMRPDVEIDE